MICTKCQQERPETDFYFRDRAKNERHRQCVWCYRKYRAEHYQAYYPDHKVEYRKRALAQKERRAKWFLGQLVGKRCVDCGESDIVVLQFDHTEQNKSFGISVGFRTGKSLIAILAEMKKCEVVCANCHMRRTARRAGWKKMMLSIPIG